MKVIGPKAECRVRKRYFKVLFGNVRSIYWFNRYTVFFASSIDLILKTLNANFSYTFTLKLKIFVLNCIGIHVVIGFYKAASHARGA